MMKKTQKTYTDAKLEIDEKLVATLLDLGIITGHSDLSRACGKNATYFACMRNRGYSLHIGSLAFLLARISRQLSGTNDIRERAKLRNALQAVSTAIEDKCRLREQELFTDYVGIEQDA